MSAASDLYIVQVYSNGDGTYTAGHDSDQDSLWSVADVYNNNLDNLNILGDIDNDTINLSSNHGQSVNFIYHAASNNGFIGNYGGNYYLFSENVYSYNDVIAADTNDDYVICFTGASQILTTRGPVAVEHLSVGDRAVTATGAEREIRWIGRRTVDCAGDTSHMAPVRIRTNAFGAGVPERDVLLSPGHPVLVRQTGVEVLVPIMNLINGTTIERTSMQSVTYWHVELDQHDVLLADGLPAESFFDMGSRAWFDNDLDDVLANPDLVPAGQHGRCRAVAIDGPLVEAERKRLADLFYADLSAQCVWPSAGEYAVQ
tara:strand:- start:68 stop:1012 length:945 start_codon:yes stop_codon:yes gene_type:complete